MQGLPASTQGEELQGLAVDESGVKYSSGMFRDKMVK